MRPTGLRFILATFFTLVLFPMIAGATDSNGPGDCDVPTTDFGDAPESVEAYIGVLGRFPTCIAPGPIGTVEADCPPISTPPAAAGFVRHVHDPATGNYWLGCNAGSQTDIGIDPEIDAKMNDTGTSISACSNLLVDCVETAFGKTFGQDECYGTDDAGLAAMPQFAPCTQVDLTFEAYNCAPDDRSVFLNILVDWNQDGDWNDNFLCDPVLQVCAYEWAVKNVLIQLPPGCNTLTSPKFLTGPNVGRGWLRITISDDPVTDDFPWNGSAAIVGEGLRGGETEDYPVEIAINDTCGSYLDYGDAPEEAEAYPGVIGHFPTCVTPTGAGTQESDCPRISSVPGPTGFVRHARVLGDPVAFWLGCGAAGFSGVDGEVDGKMNDTGAPNSFCTVGLNVDCIEPAFGMNFGQDECYGDTDAGRTSMLSFTTCDSSDVAFRATNCGDPVTVYLNVLVDWNRDGDWNDNFFCDPAQQFCAYEWAVKNVPYLLPSGCTAITSPKFLAGPFVNEGWLRVTVTDAPVSDDFPWRGSEGLPNQSFRSGETEDYPVRILAPPPDPCDVSYEDFGDAPEGVTAYPNGRNGAFPTCLAPGPIGTQEIECGIPLSTPPGPAGFVRHFVGAADADKFWLGCGPPGGLGMSVDGEVDGKMNQAPPATTTSRCSPAVTVDCNELAWGMPFGQDECYGDGDAGVPAFVAFSACSLGTVTFDAFSCAVQNQKVYLNILVDWNEDADWNDNVSCDRISRCAPEWAVKNVQIELTPGCGTYVSPQFQVGDSVGTAWMRITLTRNPVEDDFPWNGSVSRPNATFGSGETEDYPVSIIPSLIDVPREATGSLWMGPITPNPSESGSQVRFVLPSQQQITLEAFDVGGRKVRTLARGAFPAGPHTVSWDFLDDAGDRVPAGIYLVRLQAAGEVVTQRVIRIR